MRREGRAWPRTGAGSRGRRGAIARRRNRDRPRGRAGGSPAASAAGTGPWAPPVRGAAAGAVGSRRASAGSGARRSRLRHGRPSAAGELADPGGEAVLDPLQHEAVGHPHRIAIARRLDRKRPDPGAELLRRQFLVKNVEAALPESGNGGHATDESFESRGWRGEGRPAVAGRPAAAGGAIAARMPGFCARARRRVAGPTAVDYTRRRCELSTGRPAGRATGSGQNSRRRSAAQPAGPGPATGADRADSG